MITLSFKLEIRDDHIKLPETLVEVTASVETYADLTDLPNVGAVVVHMLGENLKLNETYL